MFTRNAISPIEVVACATLPQEPVHLIPRTERLMQGNVRFDSLLDLVKRETEFTRRSTWSPAPRVGSPRGKYRDRYGSVFVPGA